MNHISYIIPLVIIYTSLIIYIFNNKIIHSLSNNNIPPTIYLLIIILISQGILGSLICLTTSYLNCSRFDIYNIIKSGYIMSIWQLIPFIILVFVPIFLTPFKNIWIDNENKSMTIAFSFFLSIFAILSSIVIYYDTRMNVCGPNADAIEENVAELDKQLNS